MSAGVVFRRIGGRIIPIKAKQAARKAYVGTKRKMGRKGRKAAEYAVGGTLAVGGLYGVGKLYAGAADIVGGAALRALPKPKQRLNKRKDKLLPKR